MPLFEIGRFVAETHDQTVYHKDLRRVAYAFADTAGRAPAEVILDVRADLRRPGADLAPAPRPVASRTYAANGSGRPWSLPAGIELEWAGEGEWNVTLDVFRDLGLAFLAACLGIYVLLVHATKSYARRSSSCCRSP